MYLQPYIVLKKGLLAGFVKRRRALLYHGLYSHIELAIGDSTIAFA
jgi:hypothetical protein